MDDQTAIAIVQGNLPCDDRASRLEAEQVYMRLFFGEEPKQAK